MKVRGKRECRACRTRWSYYETGEISCPQCGSVRSVGTGERTEHTAGTATFDLTEVRNTLDEQPLRQTANQASTVAAEYLRTAGFIDAGTLKPLEDLYVGAAEVRRVGATLGRRIDPTVDEEAYFLALLRGADGGERPAPSEVPETLQPERGLAIAAAVDVYLDDIRRLRDGAPARKSDSELDSAIAVLRTHKKRVEALDGAVDPSVAEQLRRAASDIGTYVREGDETALCRVSEYLKE